MEQKIENIKNNRACRAAFAASMVLLAIAATPLTSGAIDRKADAEVKTAQVRQDINNGYYSQTEYDCDFDDCSDDEVYLASAQKAASKYANDALYRIKQMKTQWEGGQ